MWAKCFLTRLWSDSGWGWEWAFPYRQLCAGLAAGGVEPRKVRASEERLLVLDGGAGPGWGDGVGRCGKNTRGQEVRVGLWCFMGITLVFSQPLSWERSHRRHQEAQ